MIQLQGYNCNGLPIAILDNFYNENEYNSILNELIHLTPSLIEPVPELAGYHADGSPKKKNLSMFIDHIYGENRSQSAILTSNRKIFSKELVDKLIDFNIFFKYLRIVDTDSTLISYYTDEGKYDKHFDMSLITAVSWFYKEPKSFTGGDLVIEDQVKIECIKNRVVIFPSILEHMVETVKSMQDNMGRYTVSQFATKNF